MKLISLNVGLFEKNNKKLGDFFKKENADILALQEVTKQIDEFADQDLISKDAIDRPTQILQHSFFAPNTIMSDFEQKDFHGKSRFAFTIGGKVEFGNYIKTRFPMSKGQNIFLQNHFTYNTDWSLWPEEDYRSVQVVDLHINKKKLRILNYHGIWTQHKRGTEKTRQACSKIKELALGVEYPSIICGDFNLFPDTPSMKVFYDSFISLVDTNNIRSTRPSSNELHGKGRNVVDYILITKDIKVDGFRVLKTNVSDHLPLIMDFDL